MTKGPEPRWFKSTFSGGAAQSASSAHQHATERWCGIRSSRVPPGSL